MDTCYNLASKEINKLKVSLGILYWTIPAKTIQFLAMIFNSFNFSSLMSKFNEVVTNCSLFKVMLCIRMINRLGTFLRIGSARYVKSSVLVLISLRSVEVGEAKLIGRISKDSINLKQSSI
ncbi:hypothetical protein WICPIJ_006058 [Wickerhamomyces pijperi]|uniref:Uncharacterized protein n=1 Tax=Wickerhamomyces pijperi TaxID=599730 RepID=A0A9P8TLR7_WICPI|nr:hypothetical protein WICPIJ_006058 [Wickerhamomyces pijperi]